MENKVDTFVPTLSKPVGHICISSRKVILAAITKDSQILVTGHNRSLCLIYTTFMYSVRQLSSKR